MATSPQNPAVVTRSPEEQEQVDRETDKLALYYYETCPFCIRVLRTIERLRLKIELRNIRKVPAYREQLLQGGGDSTVPCLLIHNDDGSMEWLYESDAIMSYLEKRFA
ncbi:glutathione S-transferase N-terminal domain-containing protein [Aquisalimonas lutea]|uniref:glutaredoxin family protein n=1 Tax=Aquisalimonas lutea TaxID=1327750 RepID=UPI0025B340F4|nr:glutathione S-transferase N-terminal domain-containing protein [Aquisalimonas lutea]MDN3516328.1 glutathione S-transferase N-terminal domain-containing protein [Aquisalimonas lutea]